MYKSSLRSKLFDGEHLYQYGSFIFFSLENIKQLHDEMISAFWSSQLILTTKIATLHCTNCPIARWHASVQNHVFCGFIWLLSCFSCSKILQMNFVKEKITSLNSIPDFHLFKKISWDFQRNNGDLRKGVCDFCWVI